MLIVISAWPVRPLLVPLRIHSQAGEPWGGVRNCVAEGKSMFFFLNFKIVKTILLQLGISDKVTVSNKNKSNNSGKNRTESSSNEGFYREILQNVDYSTLEKLLDFHRLDFELFGYDIRLFEDILREKKKS